MEIRDFEETIGLSLFWTLFDIISITRRCNGTTAWHLLPCIPSLHSDKLSLGISKGIGRKPIDSAHPPRTSGAFIWDAAQSFQGVGAMFRVIKYQNVSGKILATIETDDQSVVDFNRFFGSINKFVDLFHYRMRSAKCIDLYQKTVPSKLALAKKEQSEQLERYRNMTGTRIEKMRTLKEIRICNGEEVTLDQIDAELRIAKKAEKDNILNKISRLHDNGKSLDDISTIIDIPKSTVARYIKKLRPPAPPSEKLPVARKIASSAKEA